MAEGSLISDEYRDMQRALHENPEYGVASLHYAPLVAGVMDSVGADELLDYGAGKGRLGIALREHIKRPLTVHHYEPAVPEWSAPPAPWGMPSPRRRTRCAPPWTTAELWTPPRCSAVHY